MAVKQTAGREKLGTFAPKFAELNDDVLFGEVWSREDYAQPARSEPCYGRLPDGAGAGRFLVPVSPDDREENGITKAEIAEILTHAAFYAGWPKAWAAFNMAKEVWAEDETPRQREGRARIGAFQTLFSNFRRNSHA